MSKCLFVIDWKCTYTLVVGQGTPPGVGGMTSLSQITCALFFFAQSNGSIKPNLNFFLKNMNL